MKRAVETGKFREDLYYRLSTVNINVPPLRDRGNDILLLTRTFATDFADRYRTPAVSFDEEAQHALLHYPWPGNVRQLKNVIEQIALFDAGEEVNPSMLRGYIPEGATVFAPTVSHDGGSHSYSAEREVLFNMIFRMRNEIDSLRAAIDSMEHGGTPSISEIDSDDVQEIPRSLVRYSPVHDITHNSSVISIDNESNMTLEETERETIKRALERNEGRRKATANELNISERTLYRKIKEYGLE
jgi:DNA-binding NtrC family response regulator